MVSDQLDRLPAVLQTRIKFLCLHSNQWSVNEMGNGKFGKLWDFFILEEHSVKKKQKKNT